MPKTPRLQGVKPLSLHLRFEQYQAVVALAERENRTVSGMIRELLDKGLEVYASSRSTESGT